MIKHECKFARVPLKVAAPIFTTNSTFRMGGSEFTAFGAVMDQPAYYF